MKKTSPFRPLVALVLGGVVACSAFDEAPPSPQEDAPDGGAAPIDGVSTVCDDFDPKEHPECVDDRVGSFVDGTSGDDANDGTKAKPFKTIAAALAKSPKRVFVCGGTYAEALVVSGPVRIDGGFTCDTWQWSASKTLVAPAGGEPAVTIKDTDGVVIGDLEMTSRDAVAPGESSIAVFVSKSKVSFRRSTIVAGSGKAGADGANGAGAGTHDVSPNGNAASGIFGGAAKTCTCSSGGTTTGGMGANAPGSGVMTGNPGLSGMPLIPANPPGANGAGGVVLSSGGAQVGCNNAEPNGTGNNGADAAPLPPAPAPEKTMTVSASGITPSAGADGANGNPGQGGGGGRSYERFAGGSGGCGGCGGFGGKGGGGGGSSIGIFSFESTVSLTETNVRTDAGGNGGRGGVGAPGSAGGFGGAPADTAAFGTCEGGRGGNGGAGAAGAGGAGGSSIGILHVGPAPIQDATSRVVPGTAGAGGAGGAGNDGPSGSASAIEDAASL